MPAPADAPVSTAPGQLAKEFDITLYGPLHRAFHQYMLRQPDSSNFLYMYHGFGGEQTLFTSKLYGAAGTWTLLQRFHQKVLEIEESQKARATPIVRTGTEPMKVYRKMSPAEAGQITNHPGGHRSGLNRAMQHGSTPQYRKFFTTSLSHTAVFTNENATTGDDIVLEFTLPWQGYWDFVRRYGTPNQRPGAYDVVDSALLHQEQLRAGPDANFRTAAAVDAVIEHVTHHNIGIGHGNAQPFHAMVTQVRPVTRQEVDRAAAEADAARRSAVVRRVNELIDDDIARYAAEQNAAAASGSSLSAEPLPAAPAPRHDSAPPRGEPSGPTPAGPSAPVRVEAPAPDRAETLDSGRAETPDSGRAEAPAPFQAEVPASFQAGPSAPVPVETPAPVRPDRAPALVDSLLALSAKDLCDALAVLPAAHVRWLASHPPLVEGLRAALPPSGFASAAARLLTVVPDGVARPVSARDETYARLEGMLGDPDVAARLLLSGAEVVVLPQDAPLSGVSSFAGLHGDPGVTGGRSLDELRGATTARTAALPEENLLGERTPVGPAPHQAEGYSTATHELAHLIHLDGLTDADRRLIDRSFTEKRAKGADEEWPDGVRRDLTGRERDNYSATDPYEYFAQATNAYLGTNHGTDAATGRPRNNGPDWVRAHEPALTPLLRRLYGERPAGAPRRPANPVRATDADNARYEAFRDFWDGLSGPSDTPQDPPRTLTDDTLAPASVPTPARPHAVVAASPAVSADDLTTTAAPPADTATPPAVPIVTVTPPDDAPDTGGEPPVSGYVRAFGSGESPTPGLVAVEPPAPATVTVLRGLLIEHLGVRDDDAVAHADLDRRLAPEQLEEHLSALLAPDGHPVTVTVDGTPRTVAVRLSLTHAGPSPRFGEHGTGPEHRLERRASAAQSTTDTDGSATSRTLSTGWNGTFPLRAENKNLSLFALRGAVQLSLTHNQFSSSTSVTDTLQVTSAQRSNELSRPHTYDVRWQLRSGDVDPNPNPNPDPEPDPNRHPNPNPNPNPDPASADGRDIPLRDLGRRGGGTAGQITVWFPEHLASDDHLAGPDVVAAHPDTLPLWSADSITEPDALARFVRDRFAGELAELSEASRREVDVLLSEPEIRGAMPLLRDGVYSPVLVDADGEAVGMFKVGAVVTPRRAQRTTVPGKVNLESHLAHGQKVDVAAKTTSGLALEGAVSGALTKGRPQPSATPDSDGALTGRLGASYQTSRTLGSGGSAVLQHSLRSKASHVLSEADVEYTVEFVRAHGGTRSATTGTWPGGLRLRSLRHEDAAGATPESPRFLSPELEGARALGVSATPLAV
ncbi:hypothetical protein [Streptomyces sp. NPDC096068]|uniref:hypothetical protein n=1 Tax=Streptomyces sp. NPDC096068 TaxID=3155424 RepID=UPI003319DCFF